MTSTAGNCRCDVTAVNVVAAGVKNRKSLILILINFIVRNTGGTFGTDYRFVHNSSYLTRS